MTTFSRHLFRALLPGFLIVLLGSGLLIKVLIGRSLTSEFDRGLVSRAQALMAITEQGEDGVELEVYPEALTSYFQTKQPDYFEIRDSEARRLFRSASLEASQSLVPGAAPPDGLITDTRLPDGRSGRLIHRSYYPKIDIDDNEEVARSAAQRTERVEREAFAEPGAPVQVNDILIIPEQLTVTVATSRAALDANLAQMNTILLLTGLLTTSVLILLQRRTIRRAVGPIEHISAQISDLDLEQMDRSLTLSRPIHELDVLTTRFNALMSRLREGFERERRFSSDLAHEMRTPLAELRSLAEVMQRWPADKRLKASFNDDVLASVKRMERLIQSLLALSRGELGLMSGSGTVDLNELIPHMLTLYQQTIDNKGMLVALDLPSGSAKVEGIDHWPRILENLIDNAVEYGSADSTLQICLKVDTTRRRFSLAIDNDAPDLTDNDLSHVLDRLWRKDQARTSARHCGLGLSLVQMYAAAVGSRVAVDLAANQRFVLTISGPLGPQTLSEDAVNTPVSSATSM